MNNNSALNPQDETSAQARVDFRETRGNGMCEDAPCCGCCGQNEQPSEPEPQDEQPYDGGGWGGDVELCGE